MRQLFRMAFVVAAAFLSFGWARASSALGLDVLATFDPAQGELPESVTIDDGGNLYLSMSNTVRKRTPDGQLSLFGTLPLSGGVFALGVKVGPDGCVYTVSTSLNAEVAGAFVWKICSPGNVEMVTTLNRDGHPNDLAFDDDGNLYVTDPLLGVVWKVLPDGTASIWLSDPLLQANFASPVLGALPVGVDGIAFDKQKSTLYLSNLDFGRILCVPFQDGNPGIVSIFAEDPLLVGSDGIAFDNADDLYVAVNFNDRLVVLDHQARISVLAEGPPLDGVSSLVFGTRPHDQRTLYITSSAFARAFGIQPGTPHPALLKADVQNKGLPLP